MHLSLASHRTRNPTHTRHAAAPASTATSKHTCRHIHTRVAVTHLRGRALGDALEHGADERQQHSLHRLGHTQVAGQAGGGDAARVNSRHGHIGDPG